MRRDKNKREGNKSKRSILITNRSMMNFNNQLNAQKRAERRKQMQLNSRLRQREKKQKANKYFNVEENDGSFWRNHYENLRRKRNNIHATVETISLEEEENEDKGNIVSVMLEKDNKKTKNLKQKEDLVEDYSSYYQKKFRWTRKVSRYQKNALI